MNIELLNKVKAAILEHPDKFHMGSWCGTACCIAGHVVQIADPECMRIVMERRLPGYWISDRAAELLELSNDEASRLFFVATWPEEDQEAADDADDLNNVLAFQLAMAMSKVAAARIDRFIKTNGRE